MKTISKNLIYLIRAAIKGETPDISHISDMDAVLRLAKIQSVIPYIYDSLKNAGCKEILSYAESMKKDSARKTLQEFYKEQVSAKLLALSVPHVFLKGKDIEKFLPKNVSRFSCDVDIYYPEEYRKIVNEAMLSIGFTKRREEQTDDVYFMPPCVCFEMHFKADSYKREIYSDFSAFENKGGSLYQMKDEDIYLYQIIHAAKHFKVSGIGLRALTDIYLIGQNLKGDSQYIEEKLNELGLVDFEKHLLYLAKICFDGAETDSFYEQLLEFIVNSATYGSVYNKTLIQVNGDGNNKKRQFIKRMFPSFSNMKIVYPSLKKLPFLLPFYWCHRLIKALLFSRKKVKAEMGMIENINQEAINNNKEMFEKLNI